MVILFLQIKVETIPSNDWVSILEIIIKKITLLKKKYLNKFSSEFLKENEVVILLYYLTGKV